MHIIPFKRGSDVRSIIIRLECLIISVPLANTQWLRLIIENRPKYEERLASLRSCKVDKNSSPDGSKIISRSNDGTRFKLKSPFFCK